MPGDIRAYFNAVPKKTSQTPQTASCHKIKNSRQDDSVILETPTPKKNKVNKKKRKIESDSDDSEKSFVPSKVSKVKKELHREESKIKVVSKIKETKAIDVFGTAPVQRSSIKSKDKKEKNMRTESGIHLDEKFENALIQLDDEKSKTKNSKKNGGVDKKLNEKSPHKDSIPSSGKNENKIKSPMKNQISETPTKKQISKTPTDKNTALHKSNNVDNSVAKNIFKKKLDDENTIKTEKNRENSKSSPKSKDNSSSPTASKFFELKKKLNDMSETKKDFSSFVDDVGSNNDCKNLESDKKAKTFISPTTPKTGEKSRKRKLDDNEKTPELTDEERHERKRFSAQLYKNYLNRSGPKHHGSKEVPEGSPNCLKGLAFLITGVLDSFEREEVLEIIKKYSGEVKLTLSGKVTHLICGDDAGPAKIAKAEKLGTKIITEDQFLDLIKQKSLNVSDTNPPINSDKSSKSIKNSKIDNKTKDKSKSPKKKNINNNLDKNVPIIKKSQNVSKIEVHTEKIINENEVEKIDVIDTKQNISADKNTAWVDKYRPTTMKQIIGQHGDASCASKLHKWLSKWYQNRKAKLPKPSPWSKGDGGYYRAILLSGSPGVGKTTTVAVVSKELGFDTVEFNASDTRSKNLIQQQITELTCTNSLSGFVNGKSGKGAVSKKHLIIMDEVDGMAGNEDRGGMQELINLIKKTEVPIVCICNDKSTPKMRSLLNYCYDVTFPKPKVEQIKAALRTICFKEGIKIPPDSLTELIIGASQDMRQILNLLSMWSSTDKNMSAETITQGSKMAKKDIKMGPWTTCRSIFSEEEHKKMTIHDKSDLFFNDYSLMPLFVHQNYLKVVPHCPKKDVLKRFAEAADCLSTSDLVDSKIRRGMAWNLLPTQAVFSTVIPGSVLSGHIQGQIDFPGWLGQNSRTNKMNRLAQEIQSHTRLSASGSKEAVRLDYALHIRNAVLHPLTEGADGIQKAVDTLQSYNLLRDDLDSLIELTKWPGQKDINASIDSRVKAAMTKKYNKEAAPLPYSQGGVKKGTSTNKDSGIDEFIDPENIEEVEENEDSDMENDAMIKKNKTTAKGKSEKKENSSKHKGKGKGKKNLK